MLLDNVKKRKKQVSKANFEEKLTCELLPWQIFHAWKSTKNSEPESSGSCKCREVLVQVPFEPLARYVNQRLIQRIGKSNLDDVTDR